jgi:hypothetical protein
MIPKGDECLYDSGRKACFMFKQEQNTSDSKWDIVTCTDTGKPIPNYSHMGMRIYKKICGRD